MGDTVVVQTGENVVIITSVPVPSVIMSITPTPAVVTSSLPVPSVITSGTPAPCVITSISAPTVITSIPPPPSVITELMAGPQGPPDVASIKSASPAGGYAIKNIRLTDEKKIVITYDDTPVE